MAEFERPERDKVIILDWKEKGGEGIGESCGSAEGSIEDKKLKVSYFIESVHRKTL